MKCCLGSSARSLSISPTLSGGITASASSSGASSDSSRDSTYTAVKPANLRVEPWARKRHVPGGDVGGHRVVDRGQHLAREEALPDQPVERELVLGEEARQHLGLARHRARADRLVRFLRALLGLVDGRRVGQVLAPQPPGHPLAGLLLRLRGHAHRVGAHVGDETDRALVAELDALVELLGQHHRLLGREVELAARVLLQRGGDERRGAGFRRRSPRVTDFTVHWRAVERGHHRGGGRLVGRGRPSRRALPAASRRTRADSRPGAGRAATSTRPARRRRSHARAR